MSPDCVLDDMTLTIESAGDNNIEGRIEGVFEGSENINRRFNILRSKKKLMAKKGVCGKKKVSKSVVSHSADRLVAGKPRRMVGARKKTV